MDTKLMLAKLHAGEQEGGMEMVQVAFSLLFAVTLGALVAVLVNGTIADGIQSASDSTATIFSGLIDSSSNAAKSF